MYSFIIVSIRIKYENCIIVYIVEVIMKLFCYLFMLLYNWFDVGIRELSGLLL